MEIKNNETRRNGKLVQEEQKEYRRKKPLHEKGGKE